MIASAHYHLNGTIIAFQVLQYHHIDVYSAEIIFENGNALSLSNKVRSVFFMNVVLPEPRIPVIRSIFVIMYLLCYL